MNSGLRAIRISDIAELTSAKCRIKYPEKVQTVIRELIGGGTKRLQVISDFDHTLTKQGKVNGRNVESSFGMLDSCKSLSQTYIERSKALYLKYRPMEVDPKIPMDEKIKLMVEWWSQTSENLKGFKFPKAEIDEVAALYTDCIRDGTQSMMELLNRHQVPVLVFSAGLGDSVISLLRQSNVYLPNVKVVSNFLQYGPDGMLNGLQERVIHTFNKNEHALEGTDYYSQVQDRDHVIVMGDSLGDATMAAGVPAQSHVLKIGFLYDHAEEQLEKYMDTFDIVLIDDQTMNVPTRIIQLIVDAEASDPTPA